MRSANVVAAILMVAVWFVACGDDTGANVGPMTGAGSGAVAAGAGAIGAAGTGTSGSSAAGSMAVGAAGAAAGAAGRAAAGVSGGVAGSGAAGSAAAAGSGGSVAGGSGAAGSAAAAGGGGSATAGSGGSTAAGSGGSAGSTGSAGEGAPTATMPPCLTKGSQVVFLGDSYINYDVAHTALNTLIEQNATKEMRLPAGQHYRSYAIPGTALAAPNLLGMIPPQWDQAVSEDPDIKFVIMDGGGNDVLIDNQQCLADGADKDSGCQMVVADTLRVGKELITKIRDHGVHDGIYFFYPHVPAGGNDINDYSLAMLKDSAASLATDMFRTYVLDLIPVFDGHDDWFASDGIHANDTGEQAIADQIWKLMKDNCIAQPESAGCCTP